MSLPEMHRMKRSEFKSNSEFIQITSGHSPGFETESEDLFWPVFLKMLFSLTRMPKTWPLVCRLLLVNWGLYLGHFSSKFLGSARFWDFWKHGGSGQILLVFCHFLIANSCCWGPYDRRWRPSLQRWHTDQNLLHLLNKQLYIYKPILSMESLL